MSLKLMLEAAASQYGGKTAIVSGDRRLSYADLDEASDKLAHTLVKMGVSKGDRVVMLLANSPEFVVTYFGIVKTGAIAVPLDTKYKIDELTSLLNDCLPKVLVAENPVLELLIPVLSGFKFIEHVIDASGESHDKFTDYQQIMAAGPAPKLEVELEPDDIAHIAYTSGPSFYPTGVVLSHRCLVSEIVSSADGVEQTDSDILPLFALPMHHMLGLIDVLLASIYKGSTIVILSGLSIPALAETIEREKCTIFMGVPFIYALMVRMVEEVKHDLSSLRLCVSAGAPLPVDLIRDFKQHYGLDIIDFWGLTEAVCLVTALPINGTRKLGSVGKVLPGWEVKVVDDGGRELPPNQAGEVIVRGPLMKEYYHNPQATARMMKDGWLYTGDISKLDEDGNLFITGRKKETIIVKGQNIHPEDIEHVLHTHPKVAEAVVMGIPEEMRGEVVGVVIRLKEGQMATEQEIKQFCLERIANYKVPKQVMFMDSLPTNAAGKIDKESIRNYFSIPALFKNQ